MTERLTYINEQEGLGLTGARSVPARYVPNGSVRVAINNMARLGSVPEELRKQELERIKIEGDTSATEIPPNLRDLALAIETGSWDKTAAVLRRLREEGEDPEGLRRGLLAWHTGVLLSEKAFCRGKRFQVTHRDRRAARELFQHRFRRACGRSVSSGYRRDITGKQAKNRNETEG